MELPERDNPTSLQSKLGHHLNGKNLLQFNNFNKGKSVFEEGFPLVSRIPLKVGTDL